MDLLFFYEKYIFGKINLQDFELEENINVNITEFAVPSGRAL